jgi:fatty-acyl-CoA synthase
MTEGARLANALENSAYGAAIAWRRLPGTTPAHGLYFAVPCMGAVLHPLNLRLPGDQLAYIVNHAEIKCCSSIRRLPAGRSSRRI